MEKWNVTKHRGARRIMVYPPTVARLRNSCSVVYISDDTSAILFRLARTMDGGDS